MNWYVLAVYLVVGAVMAVYWASIDWTWFHDWRRVAWGEVALAFALWPLFAVAFLIAFIDEKRAHDD